MSSFWQSDRDSLLALGFGDKEVRDALAATNGDRNGARYILEAALKGKQSKRELRRLQKDNLSWRGEKEDDWHGGIQTRALPTLPQNRALHKSPVYVSVTDYRHRPDGHYHAEKYNYTVNVILKDGRRWSVEKSYADFQRLKHALPFNLCRKFKNKFPLPGAYRLVFGRQSEKFATERMLQLEEWVRELVLSERCMSNPQVLDAVYALIEAEANGGPVDASTATAMALRGQRPNSLRVSATSVDTAATAATAATASSVAEDCSTSNISGSNNSIGSNGALTSRKAARYHTKQRASPLIGRDRVRFLSFFDAPALTMLPAFDERRLPLSVQQLSKCVPMRVNIKRLHCFKTFGRVSSSNSIATPAAAAAAAAEGCGTDVDGIVSEDIVMLSATPSRSRPVSLSSDEVSSIGDELSINSDAEIDFINAVTAQLQGGAAAAAAAAADATGSGCPVHIDEEQMAKDYARDRLVVQGHKISGAHADLPAIVKLCNDMIQQVMGESDKVLPTAAVAATADAPDAAALLHQQLVEKLSKCVLQIISRTESAYFSHAALHDILDVENRRAAADFSPFIIVPESELAEPIRVDFKVLERRRMESEKERRRRSHTASIRQSLTRGALWGEDDGDDNDDNKAMTAAIAAGVGADVCEAGSLKLSPSAGGGSFSRNSSAESNTAPDTSAFPSQLPPRRRSDRMRSGNCNSSSSNSSNNSAAVADAVPDLSPSRAPRKSTDRLPRPTPSDWCIECDAQAASVFRVIDAMTMQPLLQLKVTYATKIFGLPVTLRTPPSPNTSADPEADVAAVNMKVTVGNTLLGMEKLSTTTQRDWFDDTR